MKRVSLSLFIALALTLAFVFGAQAEGGTPPSHTITGEVVSVNDAAGSFEMSVGPAVKITIFLADGVSSSGISAGMKVIVELYLNDEGYLVALSITPVVDETPEPTEEATPTPTPTETATPTPTITATLPVTATPTITATLPVTVTATPEPFQNQGFYCTNLDQKHPVGYRLSVQFAVDYEQVMSWFCNGYGFGEIRHALQADQWTEATAEELLAMKTEKGGWGQVWHELGAKPNNVPPGQAKKNPPTPTSTPLPPTDVPVDVPTDVPTGEPVEPTAEPTLTEPVDSIESAADDSQDQPGNSDKNKNKQDKQNKNNKPAKGPQGDKPGRGNNKP
jgi:hypothetical protein